MTHSRSQVVSMISRTGLIAIIRTGLRDRTPAACAALIEGGVSCVELTLSIPNVFPLLEAIRERFGERALVGVGTVTNEEEAKRAVDVGADFLVSPILKPELVAIGHAAGRPVMLGTYSPTEAQRAHEAGADFVKIFPADGLGPRYIKALLAPLPHLRLVPTGGVDVRTAADFIKAGSAALGAGSSLVSEELLETRNWEKLTQRARDLAREVRQARVPSETPKAL